MPAEHPAASTWSWCSTHRLSVPPGENDCGGGEIGTCVIDTGEASTARVCGTPATYDGVICTLLRGHEGEHRYEDTTCTCDPEAYDLGPEGQKRYFPDRGCPVHGDPEWIASKTVPGAPTALDVEARAIRTGDDLFGAGVVTSSVFVGESVQVAAGGTTFTFWPDEEVTVRRVSDAMPVGDAQQMCGAHMEWNRRVGAKLEEAVRGRSC